jgi:hypothetical protein
VVLLGDPPGDGEAEAVTWFARLQADEALEDALDLVLRHTGPVVGDDGLGKAVALSEFHVDATGGVDGGERVLDQVAQDAVKCVGIATDGRVVVGAERDGRREGRAGVRLR